LGLIASRRFDKGTITMFLIFMLVSLGFDVTIFVESAIIINRACAQGWNPEDRWCLNAPQVAAHYGLLIVGLFELGICAISLVISIQSLAGIYRPHIDRPQSPFAALSDGSPFAAHSGGSQFAAHSGGSQFAALSDGSQFAAHSKRDRPKSPFDGNFDFFGGKKEKNFKKSKKSKNFRMISTNRPSFGRKVLMKFFIKSSDREKIPDESETDDENFDEKIFSELR